MSPALDACPGVLVLHPARDGLVARIRLPGGYASGARWRTLAALARDFGDGCVDVTARGNVQLRGLRAADSEALAARAAAAGLLPSAEHDRARNITASPLAGLGGRPALRDLVDALDAALLSAPEFAALPGRFLFALDDGTGGASLPASDLALRHAAPAPSGRALGAAALDSSASGGPAQDSPLEEGFDLFVAGRHAGVRLSAAEAVPAVLAATRAALAAGVGASVTRIADLPDGGQSVAAAVGGALGAAATPEVRLPLGLAPAGVASRGGPSAGPATSSRAGGAALHDCDRFTADLSGKSVAIMDANPAPPAGGAGEEGGALVVGARLGRLSGDQIELIAGLLAPGEVVRVGIAGRLVIPLAGVRPGQAVAELGAGELAAGLPAGGSGAGLDAGELVAGLAPGQAGAGLTAAAAAAAARLGAGGLIVAADDPMGDVTACSGSACHRSLADVRSAAGPVPGHRKTHWAGCSRLCGCPPDAEPVVALDAVRYRVPGEGAA